MKPIIVFPRGQLSNVDRAAIAKAGALAVEADDPSRVVCSIPSAPIISADDLALSMLEALAERGGDGVKGQVVDNLAAKARARVTNRTGAKVRE